MLQYLILSFDFLNTAYKYMLNLFLFVIGICILDHEYKINDQGDLSSKDKRSILWTLVSKVSTSFISFVLDEKQICVF